MPRSGSYLTRRLGSLSWYVHLKLPKTIPSELIPSEYGKNRTIMKSLGTADHAEAELLAAPHIQLHKAYLLHWRKQAYKNLSPIVSRKWAAGEIHTQDGETFLATEDTLFFMDGGRVYRTEPNPFDAKVVLYGLDRTDVPVLNAWNINAHIPDDLQPRAPNPDEALIEAYASTLETRLARDCRNMWALYKEVVKKPLRKCLRDDVKPLTERLRSDGISPKTIDKRIGWLRSAVNKAIRDGKLTYNPFVAPVTRKEIASEAIRKAPFPEEAMEVARKSFHLMTVRADELKLLWLLCATTGMRLSEANSIKREYSEGGIRYVIIGKKNEQSLRRVPLPDCVLPLLPKKIDGALFSQDPTRNSVDLNRWLRRIGLHSSHTTVHSLRHRAQDRLRAAECPQDVRWELLGHERKTVAEGYGQGSSMKKLKPWIETIGH